MIAASDLRCIFTKMNEIQVTNDGDCVRISQDEKNIYVPIADISEFADALTCWVRGGNTSLANQTDAVEPDVTGRLEDWTFMGDHYSGKIFDDKKRRFAEGTVIRTSLVVSGPDEYGVITTRNSTYKLGKAA